MVNKSVMIPSDYESIVARCTPHGAGALALVRVSGQHACTIVAQMSRLFGGETLLQVSTHTVSYGAVVDAHGQDIDHVLFIVMHAPRTFTGQDTVEITCHNNPFIIEAIIERAIASGARLAENGEFTKRAVLNGKMDLVQAESLNELIHAGTQQALKASLAQLKGSFSHALVSIEKELIKALALSEASFEFIDEEDLHFGEQIAIMINRVLDTIARLKQSFTVQQQLRDGIRVALIGSVNAGKSSLFNALLDADRAIVSAIPGTTRDVVEGGFYYEGIHYTFADTAGLRATGDGIEQQGIERSHQQAHQADVLLVVVDGSCMIRAQEHELYADILACYASKAILVATKADLPQQYRGFYDMPLSIAVSAVTGHNLKELKEIIVSKATELLTKAESPFLLNQRHFNLLCGLEIALNAIKPLLAGDIRYEILSHHLKEAIATCAELTGKSISEAAMDAIFREFCVGK
jgi:tRNA modification GTPase